MYYSQVENIVNISKEVRIKVSMLYPWTTLGNVIFKNVLLVVSNVISQVFIVIFPKGEENKIMY